MNESLIEVKHLTFKRGDRIIYKDLNLKVPKGKITAIMGPSGIGKTTLLKLIGGQLLPTEGEILFDGQDICKLSNRELYEVRKRMGMLFQSGALFTDISTFDNVAFAIREHTNLPPSLIRQIVLMKLEAVGLRGAADLMPSELSGGMARRAALARAIALDPDLMMFDEPFTGQDPISMGVILSLIKRLNEALNLTSIVVSHDVQEVLSIADYAYIIADKHVIAEGTSEQLLASQDPQVTQFLQGQADGPVHFHYPAPNYIEELFSLKPRTLLRPPMLSRSSEIRRSCAYWACRSFCQFQRWLLSSNTFQPASSVQMALFALPSSKPSSGTGFAPSIRVPFFRLSAPLKTALGKRTVCLTPNRQPAVCLFCTSNSARLMKFWFLRHHSPALRVVFLFWSR